VAKKSIYSTLEMTRKEAESALADVKASLVALNRQRAEADAQSATISAGGGSKSYTNRNVADLDAKIAAVKLDYDTLLWRLGRSSNNPGPVVTRIIPRYR